MDHGEGTLAGQHYEYDEEDRFSQEPRTKPVFDEKVLDRPISSITIRPAVIVPEGTLLADAVRQMRDRRIGSTMVTRNGMLTGIFTERDLMKRVVLGEMDPHSTSVENLMSRNPELLTPAHPIAYALNAMSLGGFRHVPLVDANRRPVGIISVRDIVDYLAEFFKDKVLHLPPTPEAGIAQKREGG
jgi:CBS domain-containing protein